MIYLVTILVVLIFSFKYDGKIGYDASKKFVFNCLLFWFIAISAFAYNVGSDTVNYMFEYDEYQNLSFKELFDQTRRQPGWVLLLFACYKICSSFIFLKCVVSIILNYSVFRFIKRNTEYIFLGVFLYGIVLYLNMNFNVLRQSLSCAMFLLGYEYFKDKIWIKYYIFAILSFMFHSGGIVCLIFPLFVSFKFNKATIFISSILLISGFIYAHKNDVLIDLFSQIFSLDLEFEEVNALQERFLIMAEGPNLNFNGIIMILIRVLAIAIVLLFNLKNDSKWHDSENLFTMIYLVFNLLSCFIPVIFFRFSFYPQFIYLLSLSRFIFEFPRIFSKRTDIVFKYLMTFLLIVFTSVGPIRNLYAINSSSNVPLVVQFVPYYSVFNPQIDPVRASNFGFHE